MALLTFYFSCLDTVNRKSVTPIATETLGAIDPRSLAFLEELGQRGDRRTKINRVLGSLSLLQSHVETACQVVFLALLSSLTLLAMFFFPPYFTCF